MLEAHTAFWASSERFFFGPTVKKKSWGVLYASQLSLLALLSAIITINYDTFENFPDI